MNELRECGYMGYINLDDHQEKDPVTKPMRTNSLIYVSVKNEKLQRLLDSNVNNIVWTEAKTILKEVRIET